MKTKLFITGGGGFIGRNFINTYYDRYDITAIARIGSKIDELKCKKFVYDRDVKQLDNLFMEAHSGYGGVLHLATLYLSNHNIYDIERLIDSNITFGSEVLESACNNNIKFFINIITFSLFANSLHYNPLTFYDSTKQAFCDILELYKSKFKHIKFINLLFYNTYGNDDIRPKVLNLWHRISKSGELLEMSKGEQLIDITHIDDVVNALDIAIRDIDYLDSDVIYTIENTNRPTLRELSNIFENATNTKLNIKWNRPYRLNEIFNPISSLDSNQLCKLPNWNPSIDLSEGIRRVFGSAL